MSGLTNLIFTPTMLNVSVGSTVQEKHYRGADVRLKTQCGQREGTALAANGQEGFLVYGPYTSLSPGQYEARLDLAVMSNLSGARLDVVGLGGTVEYSRSYGVTFTPETHCIKLPFALPEACIDVEVRLWVPSGAQVSVHALHITQTHAVAACSTVFLVPPQNPIDDATDNEPRLVKPVVVDRVVSKTAVAADRQFPLSLAARIEMTVSCADCAALPKVTGAGAVTSEDGLAVQQMHDGTRVLAGGYYGEWMQTVIQRLEGHHEPQEELLFHTLLKHARPGSLMVEFGCYWAYYSNWFLGAVPQSRVICIEPDKNRIQVGQQNIQINQREAVFHVAAAGGQYRAETAFVRESDGASVAIPVWDCAKLLEQVGTGCIELLHMDTQGAELPFLLSIARTSFQGRLRFVVISTHHQCISGSATTHRDCLAALIDIGAFILSEHSVEESFSGDGLIVASFFAEDSLIAIPPISRNKPENSLFGPDPKRTVKHGADSSVVFQSAQLLQELDEKIEVVLTADGPMHIFKGDAVIGASLKTSGAFQTDKIDEVLRFLMQRFTFTPDLFADIGANIGTHLVHALKACGFTQGLAFEPDPRNYALLIQNIATNGLADKTHAFKTALSSCSGAATFELCGSNFGDHRVRVAGVKPIVSFEEDQRQTISVLTDTGDDFFEENSLKLSSKTLMWVDTQGHEGHVFTGLNKQLSDLQKPFVVCEFWPYGIERAGGKKMLFDFLNSCSVLYDINRPNWQNNSEYSLHRLEKLYQTMLTDTKNGYYPHTDILCIL